METRTAFVLRDGAPHGDYVIEKRRVSRLEDIQHWLDHLAEKVWVSYNHLLCLAEAAFIHLGLEDDANGLVVRALKKIGKKMMFLRDIIPK